MSCGTGHGHCPRSIGLEWETVRAPDDYNASARITAKETKENQQISLFRKQPRRLDQATTRVVLAAEQPPSKWSNLCLPPQKNDRPGIMDCPLFRGGEHPVRVWRDYRGMKSGELAVAAGLAASYLSSIENGKKPGSVKAMKRIAAALNISVDDLI